MLHVEYQAMRKALEEAYMEALSKDPLLETPDYMEIPVILYSKLSKYITLMHSTTSQK
jgi:hypothetical protein